MRNVICETKGCKECKRSIKAGKDFWGVEDMYKCDLFRRRHKEIMARDCGGFICKKRDDFKLSCQNCRGQYN